MTAAFDRGAPKRRGLGRGLDALLSATPAISSVMPEAEVDQEGRLSELPLAAIRPNPEQPRNTFDENDLDALADSIRLHGLLQPVVVEPAGVGYQLVAGERRLRAAERAGLRTIPAIVRPASESARQALELALTENLLRTELSPLEEATAYARLSDTFGLTHEAIGMRLGRSRATVSNLVRLLNLAPEVQQMISAGRISAGHGRALLGLESHPAQIELASMAETMAMSVRQVEFAVARRREGFTPRQRASVKSLERSPDETALERGLEEALGAPVRLERNGARGRVIIEFFSDAELDGLYARLGGPRL
ncbi:MAG: ParB/RepB/Spo0J family partition protein [Candidatus Dormibacteria bacterium]